MRNTVRMGQIRQSIPDELHHRLKLMAVEQKVPLRELIERLLTEAAEREQQ
jgi:predicted HicB family RNase H-like nuclease